MGYLNAMGLLRNNTPLRSKTGFISESGISLQQEKDITVEGMCLSLMEFYSIASLLPKTIWSSNIPCFLRYSSHFNLSHFIMYDDVKEYEWVLTKEKFRGHTDFCVMVGYGGFSFPLWQN